MEENLTLDEMGEILKSMREKEKREFKFHAAIQGIDLDKNTAEDEWERLEREAYGDDVNANDIKNLKGPLAKDNFGIGMGIGYDDEGEDI